MPFDGFGTFIRLRSWVVDATNSVKIRADFHDDEDNGFAEGLSHCITKDGQTLITQNIPWNSRRIVSLADPIDPQDAATKDYVDTQDDLRVAIDGSTPFTGDIIIRNDDPSLTLDGQDGFDNSIFGDKDGKHRWEIVLGNATPESDDNSGSDFELRNYADDGALLGVVFFGNRATGLMTVKGDPTAPLGIATKQYVDTEINKRVAPGLQVFGSSANFTVPANVTRVYVRCIGGGGGGGCVWNANLYGGAGGGGGIAEGYVDVTPAQTIYVTVGGGGAGANQSPGGVGGTSSFGAYMSATGGTGGFGQGSPYMRGGSSGQGAGGQTNSGLGDGSCGYELLFGQALVFHSAPGCGGGPGGMSGAGSGNVGFHGVGPGGGGGGSGRGELGSTGGNGYRGEVCIWWG